MLIVAVGSKERFASNTNANIGSKKTLAGFASFNQFGKRRYRTP